MEDGDVVFGVETDQLGGIWFAADGDFDFLGVLDHVVIGKDVALVIDHRARAGALSGDRDVHAEEAFRPFKLGVDVHDAAVRGLVDADVGDFFRR